MKNKVMSAKNNPEHLPELHEKYYDDTPNTFMYIEPGKDVSKEIAWTVEKEVKKQLSYSVEKEVEKKLSKIMLYQTKQFCSSTSLHGFSYIGEDNRPWWERVLWVLSISCFLIFGAYVMKPIYDKWQFVPTITSVETTNYPIWQVYFPAVTICSNNKIEMSQIDALLKKEPWLSLKDNYTNFEENLKLALVSSLTFHTNHDIYDENKAELNIARQMIHDFKDNLTFLAQKGTPPCHDMVLYCEWQGEVVNCGDFFGVRKTDNGFCCSFNTLKLTEQFYSNENIATTSDADYYDEDFTEWYTSTYYSTLTTGCTIPYWIDDGWCDILNNQVYCDFDGGDCCDPTSIGYAEEYCIQYIASLRDFCIFSNATGNGNCEFFLNYNPICSYDDGDCDDDPFSMNGEGALKCPFLFLIDDGNCDDIANNMFCYFDGGDCCAPINQTYGCSDCQCLNRTNTDTNDEGCPYPGADTIGDGICDDINNNPNCKYDGGDCCDPSANHDSCFYCGCLDPTTGPKQECYRPLWVGDGFCDDYTNHAGCDFDGGDCCVANPNKTYCHKCQCITEKPIANATIVTVEPTKLKRTNVANSNLGLTILLYPNAKEYHSSSDNNFVGFKVLVHSPYDFPEVAGKGFVVGEGAEAFIAVGAQYTTTSDEVLSLPLEKRKCLSHSEDLTRYPKVKLEAFQNYSRKACLLECQARDLQSECGCLPYFFPDFGNIWNTKTACDLKGLQCLANTTDQKKALQPEGQSDTEGYIQSAPICECPNDCEETTYTQEMSFFTIKQGSEFFEQLKKEPNILYRKQKLADRKKDPAKQRILDEIQAIIDTSSIVHIYFKEIGIVKYSRDQVYTVMDVIAAFGGIIGLCCGFSMISLVEILYWFTLRLYTDHFGKSSK